MSESARYNSPSRKSRFRAQGRERQSTFHEDEVPTEEHPEEMTVGEETVMHETDPAAYEHAVDEEPPVQGIAEDPYSELAPPVMVPPEEVPAYETGEADDSHIPAALRLTRSSDSFQPVQRGVSGTWVTVSVLAALVLGAGAGYLIGKSRSRPAAPLAASAKAAIPVALDADTQAAVDAAFTLTKQGKYEDARKAFVAIYAKHPEWASMDIEAARAALYQRDYQSAQILLTQVAKDRPLADAAFLTALLHLTAQEYDTADTSFAAAAATDPARTDIYYFWGENLRREGKPLQAAEKFKAALLRNQYENVESLYQLKYWLSLVQSDQDGPSGEGAKIDASLASPHPTGAALFAAAARSIKAGQFKDAAGFITRAEQITDPSVFRVILNDPTFQEASIRPELAGFYK